MKIPTTWIAFIKALDDSHAPYDLGCDETAHIAFKFLCTELDELREENQKLRNKIEKLDAEKKMGIR